MVKKSTASLTNHVVLPLPPYRFPIFFEQVFRVNRPTTKTSRILHEWWRPRLRHTTADVCELALGADISPHTNEPTRPVWWCLPSKWLLSCSMFVGPAGLRRETWMNGTCLPKINRTQQIWAHPSAQRTPRYTPRKTCKHFYHFHVLPAGTARRLVDTFHIFPLVQLLGESWDLGELKNLKVLRCSGLLFSKWQDSCMQCLCLKQMDCWMLNSSTE